MSKKQQRVFEIAGREVVLTNPDKVYFPEAGYTKLDLAEYYLAIAEGALAAAGGRPLVMKRYVNGISEEGFYQKRAPPSRPPWIETITLRFPSGRRAEELVLRDAAQLLWIVNLGCLELHVHAVRADDLDHPDELRIDLDPVPGVGWPEVRQVAFETRAVLTELGLEGWPKTSGSRGMHIYARIRQAWTFDEVRQAALAIAREVERRAPSIATARWWKEERHGVFLDYNQNAKDRTMAAAYSVRPTPDARVSMPLTWDEVQTAEPGDFNLRTAPERFKALGYSHGAMEAHAGDLGPALELAARQAGEGATDAPWPPHYAKTADEPPRVQPSKRRKSIMPLIEIGRAKLKEDALAGLERWKTEHPEAASHLEPADVLVDAMRGRYSIWTRVRVNLQHVPEPLRPAQAPLDPDYDPWSEWKISESS
ncbi:MAG: non-homologous end-joining DNA ligase [Deltaproteobacteria bacterium]|nr:non-homologous end-joining DNA ligase [Deltaproteobacteria bacterium]